MKLSAKGIELLKELEGCRLMPYDDQTGHSYDGLWKFGVTIGVGHLILEKDWGLYRNGINMDTAEELLHMDINPTEEAVNRLVKDTIGQNQFDALVLLAFNIGIGGLATSSVLKFINKDYPIKTYTNLEQAWMAWDKSQGKVMTGLVNRRKAEFALYKTV